MNPEYFFKRHSNLIKGGKLFLFFDFDGTLVPIQKDPLSCQLDKEIELYFKRIINKKLAPIAILSGRSLKDIKNRINIKGILYGGNHGLEISGPGIRFIHPGVDPIIKTINKARDIISKNISHIPGVFIEDKKLSFTLHFRMADEKGKKTAKSIFNETISKEFYNMPFKVLKGKQVLELAPRVDWDKGKAALYILRDYKNDCIPLYIGDDVTDETAFSALGDKGITIKVGRSKKTNAHYYLKSQAEINIFIKKICAIIDK